MCSAMPKRSRIGPVSRPSRVVAPISVNGLTVERMVRACMPLSTVNINLEILHRGIQVFFDDRRQAMDLVDEQHVAAIRAW